MNQPSMTVALERLEAALEQLRTIGLLNEAGGAALNARMDVAFVVGMLTNALKREAA